MLQAPKILLYWQQWYPTWGGVRAALPRTDYIYRLVVKNSTQDAYSELQFIVEQEEKDSCGQKIWVQKELPAARLLEDIGTALLARYIDLPLDLTKRIPMIKPKRSKK